MPRSRSITIQGALLLLTSFAWAIGAPAQTRPREQVPEAYQWNPTELFASEREWRAGKDSLSSQLQELGPFRGRLSESAQVLAAALEMQTRLEQRYVRLTTFANILSDQDTRDDRNQGMRREMVQLAAELNAAAAYLDPEILSIDSTLLARFQNSEPRLRPYRFYLTDLRRRAAHTLSDDEERILAATGPLAGSPQAINAVFMNSDFPFPEVTLSDGSRERLSQANYVRLRASANRNDRETVMSAMFGALGAYSGTLGTMMDGNVQRNIFRTRVRGYASNLERALDPANIPVEVYTRLIDGVNRHLPKLHRYLDLRKRILGVDELHYYDIYPPLVASVDLEYTPEETKELVLAAVRPLGSEYVTDLGRAFDERWIDWYPTPGKRSGAYSSGSVYESHPFVLMNYNGEYEDVSTTAHELGHAMHSFYANRAQPFETARYPIFLAEVASTFNESLLFDHMLRMESDPDVRLSLLGNYLENLRGTVFRQTQFAEFELRMHQMAEAGQPITGDALADLYLEITRKYYGHDAGHLFVDDYVAHEWSYIPHFYLDFYVYQYATSYTAAEALAQKVKAGDREATARYLGLLGSGGSAYPIDLLKAAGVDMTTDEPLDLAMREMVRVMDEIENLLARRSTPPR